jgi:hypothetical protein
MIASLYPMEESKTNAEDGFIEGNHVAVKVDADTFVCGKSRIRIYDQHGIRKKHDKRRTQRKNCTV